MGDATGDVSDETGWLTVRKEGLITEDIRQCGPPIVLALADGHAASGVESGWLIAKRAPAGCRRPSRRVLAERWFVGVAAQVPQLPRTGLVVLQALTITSLNAPHPAYGTWRGFQAPGFEPGSRGLPLRPRVCGYCCLPARWPTSAILSTTPRACLTIRQPLKLGTDVAPDLVPVPGLEPGSLPLASTRRALFPSAVLA